MNVSASSSSRLVKRLRHGTHPVFHCRTTPVPPQWSPTPLTTTEDQTSPPRLTMHPTLLEKLRLGTPTPHHIHFSTINSKQSGSATKTDLHKIHQTSPFPKLPAYFSSPSAVNESQIPTGQGSIIFNGPI